MADNTIVLLAPAVANHIAAGEVVERPASVVKELVENSLDAGASQIDIAIIDGGKKQITVRDNGGGMSPADAQLAIRRHATSKVRTLADLEGIASLGFRGEALSSIAAVAKLTITTRQPQSDVGFRLQAVAGEVQDSGPTGAPPGTEVTVQDLFFNTPARRKSLAGKATEFARISEVAQRAALGHTGVAFRVNHNGRTIWQTSGSGDLKNTILEVLGPAIARQLVPLETRLGQCRITGFIGRPAVARASRQFQFVIVNGRPVRDRALREAVEEAYRHLLPLHRWPVFVLVVTVPYSQVDVNVHPTKGVVRLFPAEQLVPAVREAAAAALAAENLIPEIDLQPRSSWARSGLAEDAQIKGAAQESQPPPGRAAAGAPAAAAPLSVQEGPALNPYGATDQQDTAAAADVKPFAALVPRLRVLGVVDRTYIVAAGPEGLYLIDQHAAHERVMFEHFLRQPSADYPLAQQLAVPQPVELSPTEMALWHQYRRQVEAFGFRVESFGPTTLLLREVPWLFRHEGSGHHLQELLAVLAAGRWPEGPVPIEADLALRVMAACKSAVKAQDSLSPSEIDELLTAMAKLDNPYTCPHGRPTIVNLTIGQLERLFARS